MHSIGVTMEDPVLYPRSSPRGLPVHAFQNTKSWVGAEGLPLPLRTLSTSRFLESLAFRLGISNILGPPIPHISGLSFHFPRNLQPPSSFKP